MDGQIFGGQKKEKRKRKKNASKIGQGNNRQLDFCGIKEEEKTANLIKTCLIGEGNEMDGVGCVCCGV